MPGFARQQCRAWIETDMGLCKSRCYHDSPGSNAGRGLKHTQFGSEFDVQKDSPGSNAGRGLKQALCVKLPKIASDSPGSNAGRGLKHLNTLLVALSWTIRPAAMPGVD